MNNSTVEPFRSKQLVILFIVNFVIILQPNVNVKVTSNYVYNYL